jgi:hypothetical protein
MWQWNLDWSYSSVLPNYPACTDCAFVATFSGPPAPSSRDVRGGSYDFDVSFEHPFFVYDDLPVTRSNGVGLRCARSP